MRIPNPSRKTLATFKALQFWKAPTGETGPANLHIPNVRQPVGEKWRELQDLNGIKKQKLNGS